MSPRGTAVLSLLSLLSLLALREGLAQTGAPGAGGVNGCSGTQEMRMISGQTYLFVDGRQLRAADGGAGTVFGLAECQCATSDISMQIVMDPNGNAIPGRPWQPELWMGLRNCDNPSDPAQRCVQISGGRLDYNDFTRPNQSIFVSLPAEVVTDPEADNPGPQTYSCEGKAFSTNVTVFLNAPSTSPPTCKLTIPVRTTPPTAPTGVEVSSGNGALTVRWDSPGIDQSVDRYQILCRRRDQPGVPLESHAQFRERRFFSVCLPGKRFFRRTELPGATPAQPGGTPDMAPMSLEEREGKERLWSPPEGREPYAADGGAADGGASMDDFLSLSPMFACTGDIRSANTGGRIENLKNGVDYEVIVVAIDRYGNPAGSALVTGRPRATQNLIERLAPGNSAVGFGCRAAPGRQPAAAPFALLLLCLILHRRRS